MMHLDPPYQRHVHRLVAQSFTPRMMEPLALRIRTITDHLLAQVDHSRSQIEVISELARPLTLAVIADLLGAGDSSLITTAISSSGPSPQPLSPAS